MKWHTSKIKYIRKSHYFIFNSTEIDRNNYVPSCWFVLYLVLTVITLDPQNTLKFVSYSISKSPTCPLRHAMSYIIWFEVCRIVMIMYLRGIYECKIPKKWRRIPNLHKHPQFRNMVITKISFASQFLTSAQYLGMYLDILNFLKNLNIHYGR